MSRVDILDVWYRAVKDESEILCETADLDELIHMCQGMQYRIQVMTRQMVTSDWTNMDAAEQQSRIQDAEQAWANNMRRN